MTNKILLLFIIVLVIISFLIDEELGFIANYYDSYAKIRYKTLILWAAQIVGAFFVIRLLIIQIFKSSNLSRNQIQIFNQL